MSLAVRKDVVIPIGDAMLVRIASVTEEHIDITGLEEDMLRLSSRIQGLKIHDGGCKKGDAQYWLGISMWKIHLHTLSAFSQVERPS